jgi:aerobic-type carbon monoxide dehydrogenase small subunit (CoxS/CutS family)
MPEIQLTVNGKTLSADVTEDMPLLWVLRDTMGLTGTKYGCGIGQCGACTVHLNGKPARSCLIPAVSVSEIDITTIEGIAKDGQLEPIQQVWIDKDVAQCGYCQAGQIMSALALLQENSKPSDKDIDEAMRGNYCRCGTYVRIRSAIHEAAKLHEAKTASDKG